MREREFAVPEYEISSNWRTRRPARSPLSLTAGFKSNVAEHDENAKDFGREPRGES